MLQQLRDDMALVRRAKARGLTVNHGKVWSDVARLAGGIIVAGLKLFGCWNPIREGWRLLRTGRNYNP